MYGCVVVPFEMLHPLDGCTSRATWTPSLSSNLDNCMAFKRGTHALTCSTRSGYGCGCRCGCGCVYVCGCEFVCMLYLWTPWMWTRPKTCQWQITWQWVGPKNKPGLGSAHATKDAINSYFSKLANLLDYENTLHAKLRLFGGARDR